MGLIKFAQQSSTLRDAFITFIGGRSVSTHLLITTFADGLAIVEENGHLLVDGVGVEKELALAEGQLLLQELIGNALDVEDDLHSKHKGARPHAYQLHLSLLFHLIYSFLPLLFFSLLACFGCIYCLDDDVPGTILHNERAELELELNLDQLELHSIWLELDLSFMNLTALAWESSKLWATT
ncbi:hypothetical protein EJ110_NYTH49702 [Nymphaea thermarum]|nr:hypothetical protein EJ110_NYTH49702 [Nymphaea thermarum]